MKKLEKEIQAQVESTQIFVINKIASLAKKLEDQDGLTGYDSDTIESIYSGYVKMRKLIKIQCDLSAL